MLEGVGVEVEVEVEGLVGLVEVEVVEQLRCKDLRQGKLHTIGCPIPVGVGGGGGGGVCVGWVWMCEVCGVWGVWGVGGCLRKREQPLRHED